MIISALCFQLKATEVCVIECSDGTVSVEKSSPFFKQSILGICSQDIGSVHSYPLLFPSKKHREENEPPSTVWIQQLYECYNDYDKGKDVFQKKSLYTLYLVSEDYNYLCLDCDVLKCSILSKIVHHIVQNTQFHRWLMLKIIRYAHKKWYRKQKSAVWKINEHTSVRYDTFVRSIVKRETHGQEIIEHFLNWINVHICMLVESTSKGFKNRSKKCLDQTLCNGTYSVCDDDGVLRIPYPKRSTIENGRLDLSGWGMSDKDLSEYIFNVDDCGSIHEQDSWGTEVNSEQYAKFRYIIEISNHAYLSSSSIYKTYFFTKIKELILDGNEIHKMPYFNNLWLRFPGLQRISVCHCPLEQNFLTFQDKVSLLFLKKEHNFELIVDQQSIIDSTKKDMWWVYMIYLFGIYDYDSSFDSSNKPNGYYSGGYSSCSMNGYALQKDISFFMYVAMTLCFLCIKKFKKVCVYVAYPLLSILFIGSDNLEGMNAHIRFCVLPYIITQLVYLPLLDKMGELERLYFGVTAVIFLLEGDKSPTIHIVRTLCDLLIHGPLPNLKSIL